MKRNPQLDLLRAIASDRRYISLIATVVLWLLLALAWHSAIGASFVAAVVLLCANRHYAIATVTAIAPSLLHYGLALTVRWLPYTYDAAFYRADLALGFNPVAIMHAFSSLPAVAVMATTVYNSIMFGMAVACVFAANRARTVFRIRCFGFSRAHADCNRRTR